MDLLQKYPEFSGGYQPAPQEPRQPFMQINTRQPLDSLYRSPPESMAYNAPVEFGQPMTRLTPSLPIDDQQFTRIPIQPVVQNDFGPEKHF